MSQMFVDTMSLPVSLKCLVERVGPSSNSPPPLQPQKPYDTSLTSEIDDFAHKHAPSKPCVRAALHLLNDDISLAHEIAQSDEEDMTSNLCHAILHRREGDFWNSKWWYRQIQHPLVKQIYGSTTQAQALVDDVESLVGGGKRGGAVTPCAASNAEKLKRRQADELMLVVQYVLYEM